MLVTIMIPTYNQEDYIKQAIHSALAQSYAKLEIIVCDDHSTDRTYQKSMEINDRRLKVYRNESNIGRVANYRKLLHELASGDYIINLDGDDYFTDNDYIAKGMELVHRYQVALVFANQTIQYPDNEVNTGMSLPPIIDGNWLFLHYKKDKIHIPHMSALYQRKRALSLDFYREDILSSDWESLLRYILGMRIAFITTPCGCWRQTALSQSKTKNIDQILGNYRYIENGYREAAQILGVKIARKWRKRMNRHFITEINYCNLYRNFNQIMKFSRETLSCGEMTSLLLHYKLWLKWIYGWWCEM